MFACSVVTVPGLRALHFQECRRRAMGQPAHHHVCARVQPCRLQLHHPSPLQLPLSGVAESCGVAGHWKVSAVCLSVSLSIFIIPLCSSYLFAWIDFVDLTDQEKEFWEEIWNVHLLITEFDRPEVTPCQHGWQGVKIQLLTNFLSSMFCCCCCFHSACYCFVLQA